ncbi:MAG: SIMPL domain-containing protein [Burkholderiales bacterium]
MAIATAAGSPPSAAQIASSGEIRVVGRGIVKAAPDHVVARVGVTTRAATPSEALDQNSATARKIIAFTKKFGIADEDIQTSAVRLSPVYKTPTNPRDSSREIDGYSAINQVQVRFKDISRLGEFMRQVLDQGATNIAGVQFGLTDQNKAVDTALASAVADARRKAQVLAQAAKVTLGPIRQILHPPQTAAGPPVNGASFQRAAAAVPVPIEAGMIEVSVEVVVVWSIQ